MADTYSRSFAGGEISPQLLGRIDLDKFQTGLGLCQNMETLPQGPAQNRPGYGYILNAKYNDRESILLPFAFSTEQTFALEFGDHYIRFHTNGGTLLEAEKFLDGITNAPDPIFHTNSAHGYVVGDWVQLRGIAGMTALSGRWLIIASTPAINSFTATDLWGNPVDTSSMPAFGGAGAVARVYEVVTPYTWTQLRSLKYVQSADVMTLVSPYYPPAELRRLGATNWTLSEIVFSTTLSPPKSSGAVPNLIQHTYLAMGFLPNAGTLSGWTADIGATASCMNDLTIPGSFNRINWTPQPGLTYYQVWKIVGGVPGFIGSAGVGGNNYVDDYGQAPDFTAPVSTLQTQPALVVSATAVSPAVSAVTVTPTGVGTTSYTYAVSSISDDGSEESLVAESNTVTNDLTTAGNVNTVRWPAVGGVNFYNVYRKFNGIFGLVGRAGNDCIFVDDNVVPNVAITPPQVVSPFIGDGNFPRAVTYHQQRRVFAGTINQPQTIWMTRSGTEKNISYSLPSRDDDAIIIRLVSREANTIRSLVPMNDLIMLTSGGEWKCGSADSDTALTPSNTPLRPQGFTGTADVQPASTDRTILYPQARGGFVREIVYSWEQAGYRTSDVSILAPHLFQYKTVLQMAFSRAPLPSLWTVRSDGILLGMTYVTEQEVRAWHQHVTLGVFESICCVAEGDEDVLYAVIRRFIQGQFVRYIERKHTRRFDTPADQFFVDSGLTYAGAPTDFVAGLYHLEGETVSILADGGVSPPRVVTGGTVELDAPASKVQVGLPYVSRGKTLPLIWTGAQAFGQGQSKNVNKVYMRVNSGLGFKVGPSFDALREFPTRFAEPYGSPPEFVSDQVVELNLDPEWQEDGIVCFQQDQPLAFMLEGMTIEAAEGD